MTKRILITKLKAHNIIFFEVCSSLLVLTLFTGCISKQPDTATSIRPACVSLESYSDVIEQVMNIQPSWQLMDKARDGFQYKWSIDDESGNHSLSATLTSDGCICATVSSSQFSMGSGNEEMVGLFQGAAVAPISNLDYTAEWLEPKIFFSCGVASFLRRSYEAEESMEDGTTWQLTCSRSDSSDLDGYDSQYTLTIVTPDCAAWLE